MRKENAVLTVPRRIMTAMRAAVQATLPDEACGLLFGRGNVVERTVPIENSLHSPVRFQLDPRAQLAAMMAAEAEGLDLLAVYHSHPHGPAHPSPTDMQEAAYPEAAYVIWWRDDAERWECSLYRLQGIEEAQEARSYAPAMLRETP